MHKLPDSLVAEGGSTDRTFPTVVIAALRGLSGGDPLGWVEVVMLVSHRFWRLIRRFDNRCGECCRLSLKPTGHHCHSVLMGTPGLNAVLGDSSEPVVPYMTL
jgi:hypothetical protein